MTHLAQNKQLMHQISQQQLNSTAIKSGAKAISMQKLKIYTSFFNVIKSSFFSTNSEQTF